MATAAFTDTSYQVHVNLRCADFRGSGCQKVCFPL